MPPDVIPFEPESPATPGLRVLIADDNADTVLTLSFLLVDEGHEVQALEDGSNVARTVREFRPDVIILDIEMPGQNGYALARELRERRLGDRPLLIAISGVYVRPADRLLALMVGFDHFFQKPADPKELLALLNDFRAGRKAAGYEERVHLARKRA
jgi:two-component system, OmpR family, response regulator